MHNLKDIRKNSEVFKKKIMDRNVNLDLNELINLDKNHRLIIQKKESLENEKKTLSKSKDEKNFKRSKELSSLITKISSEQTNIKKKIDDILSNLPNIALNDVPIGKDEKSNKTLRKEGEVKKFNFKILSHSDLGEKKNQIDFNTASKISGSRFVILKKNFAYLERALINFMIDIHVNEFNYTEISPPLIVNESTMFGTGQLPKFEDDQFEIKFDNSNERKFLIPTAEVALTNIVKNSIIKENELPLRFVAGTACFRKEAGSYGKDTRGMMRQHQFYKVELVSVVNPNSCNSELDRMLSCAEAILKKLEIPYQVVLLSSGDMGFSAEKTYDLEAWIPS